jgi:chaperone LolA
VISGFRAIDYFFCVRVQPRIASLMIAKRFLLLTLLLSSLTTAAFAQPLAPNDVKVLLDKIRAKHAGAPQLQADFQEQKEVHLMNKPIVSSGKVWFQQPSKFRREVKGSSPSITVSDGNVLWIYYPKFQSAEKYSLGKRSPLDAGIAALTAALNLQEVERSYRITGSKEGDGYELLLAPRNPSLKRLLKSFDLRLNSDLQVQRTEMVQPNGDHIVTTYTNESRAAIPADTFQFSPPAGTNVTTPLGK